MRLQWNIRRTIEADDLFREPREDSTVRGRVLSPVKHGIATAAASVSGWNTQEAAILSAG